MAMTAARETPMAEINITPLVDVMLVLLVIFMLATPMVTRTLALDLPYSVPPDRIKPVSEMTLQVQAGDLYALDGQAMSRAQITQALATAKAANPDLKVNLDVDGEADHQSAMRGMAAVRNAGIEGIGLPARD